MPQTTAPISRTAVTVEPSPTAVASRSRRSDKWYITVVTEYLRRLNYQVVGMSVRTYIGPIAAVVLLAAACGAPEPSSAPAAGEGASDELTASALPAPVAADERESEDTPAPVPTTTVPAPGSAQVAAPLEVPQTATGTEGTSPPVEDSGDQVPIEDLPIALFSGETMRLSDLKGKIVVLNFWASWCPPCRWEMPSFENIWREYQSEGVVFVGIAEDFEVEAARAFAEKVGITYPIGMDTKGRFARDFQVFQMPTTFLLDREGNQAKKISNVANEGVLKVFLRGLLDDG